MSVAVRRESPDIFMPSVTTILWVYIVLLFLGGLMGFLKAGSKMSLIMSATFAAILIVCNSTTIFSPSFAHQFTTFVLAFLLVFFALRLIKSKKVHA